MFDNKSKRGRIIMASLKLAKKRGWRDVTLADIARKAGMSLGALHRRFRSKSEILAAFVDAVDAEVLKRVKAPDMDAPARDRLFDVLMTRLDVLEPYKAALRRIHADARCALPGPGTARFVCAAMSSHGWMLNAAGIPTGGAKGCARVSGMMCLYGRVVPVWLKDDDPDQAKTMAVLDRELRDGERWLKRLDAICGDLKKLACCFAPRRRKDASGRGAAPTVPERPVAG